MRDGWTIREIEPSTGYLLNETIYEVGASPSLYEVELNTTENQVTETVIYGNIQLVKHTDDLDPDVPEGEIPTIPMPVSSNARKQAQSLKFT